jgi:hypothetical protein
VLSAIKYQETPSKNLESVPWLRRETEANGGDLARVSRIAWWDTWIATHKNWSSELQNRLVRISALL